MKTALAVVGAMVVWAGVLWADEQCFVDLRGAKERVAVLEEELSKAKEEIIQYKTDYPGTPDDSSVPVESEDLTK